ncbi:MAG: 3-dehydroquinate synthase [Acidimicrobiia bacterium]|nr:3-dehydroquinate synthase [Acidimicrobiia bacterium]MBP8180117.1 3-dehydroquinate synthase [Acidimicrobiia bacterium]
MTATTAMTTIPVPLGDDRSYDIYVGPAALAQLETIATGYRRIAVVTQPPIAQHWLDEVAGYLADGGAEVQVHTMGAHEADKNLRTVEQLSEAMAEGGILRGDAVVALGGGVVGDTAGFVAAVYARGIDVVQVGTTLLAQVDSAIGGKTAVNVPQGKNLVGAFHQPVSVISDSRTLGTLDQREFSAGLGEVAKYASLDGSPGSRPLEALLTEHAELIAQRDPDLLSQVVARCSAIKARVVSEDEFERTGLRATLNFGHTFAHALESLTNYRYLHGEAVAVGIVFASAVAEDLQRVPGGTTDRYRTLLMRLGLPIECDTPLSREQCLTVMRRDKKSVGGITMVLDGPSGVELVHDPAAASLAKGFDAVHVG